MGSTGYPFYLLTNQVPEGAVVDLAEGWTKPCVLRKLCQCCCGKSTIYQLVRHKRHLHEAFKDPTGNDYNRSVGFNKYVDDQLILTSLRYHNDNPSLSNPRCDLRLNNKRQLQAHSEQGGNLGITDTSPAPARMMMTGFPFKDGNIFYESAAFKYTDEDLYEEVIAEANTYFSTTPLGDSQHAPE